MLKYHNYSNGRMTQLCHFPSEVNAVVMVKKKVGSLCNYLALRALN